MTAVSTEAARLLVVDDDRLIALGLKLLLSSIGFTVTLAHDGEEALEAADADGPPDLLVTDMDMPRLDGKGLIHRLRARQPGLPVVVMSGSPYGSIRSLRAETPGPLEVLSKPASETALVEAINHLLSARLLSARQS